MPKSQDQIAISQRFTERLLQQAQADGFREGKLQDIEVVANALIQHVRETPDYAVLFASSPLPSVLAEVASFRKAKLRRVACRALGVSALSLLLNWALAAVIDWCIKHLFEVLATDTGAAAAMCGPPPATLTPACLFCDPTSSHVQKLEMAGELLRDSVEVSRARRIGLDRWMN